MALGEASPMMTILPIVRLTLTTPAWELFTVPATIVELLLVSGSTLVAVTVGVVVIGPPTVGSITIRMTAVAPDGRVPTLAVTTPAEWNAVPSLVATDWNVVPAGTAAVSWVLAASDGPKFVTLTRRVTRWPTKTGAVTNAADTDRSASPVADEKST